MEEGEERNGDDGHLDPVVRETHLSPEFFFFFYHFISCISQVGLMPRPLLLTKLCKDLETEPERGMNQPIGP